MNIYLDLDGVLVDFVGGLCKRCGKPYPYTQPESLGEWNCYGLMGLTKQEVFESLSDPQFWLGLAFTHDAMDILRACRRTVGPHGVSLLSCASGHPGAVYGKAMWQAKYLPGFQLAPVIEPNYDDKDGGDDMPRGKAVYARPGAILVDDSDANVEAYRDQGGPAILVPRPWNTRHVLADRAAECVTRELASITEEMEAA